MVADLKAVPLLAWGLNIAVGRVADELRVFCLGRR